MKSSKDFDVMIVGSGPAGVSAAFPLLEAGLKVLMVDGGKKLGKNIPDTSYQSWRQKDPHQFARMVGSNFYSLRNSGSSSPKLRIPNLSNIFNDFASRNRIHSTNFSTIGSLAVGGLSNAWGCGVAKYSNNELKDFPFLPEEINQSYEWIANRIGLSGSVDDDLSGFFGLDQISQSPIALDQMNSYLLKNYSKASRKNFDNFKIGRLRVAALSKGVGDRLACNQCGNCLWGCARGSLYSAADEIENLKNFSKFYYKPGFIVDSIHSNDDAVAISGGMNGTQVQERIQAKKLLLAAGTLASTRLAFSELNIREERPLLSSSTAAFMMTLPKYLGHSSEDSFGSGQLAFHFPINNEVNAYGATFSISGIPINEFLPHLPLQAPHAIQFLRAFISSCIVGNIFLPGKIGGASFIVSRDGVMQVGYIQNPDLPNLMKSAKGVIKKKFGYLGAWMLPGSFTLGTPGADIHYVGTMPMRANPKIGESHPSGEIHALRNVYSIDGASLPVLSERPHTLTIMANADRIARKIISEFKNRI